jgi:DNA-directed RNA polymerase subunit RPC12/RpoP
MRVIRNNNVDIGTTESEEYICEQCNSIFVYDDYDIYTSQDGTDYVDCPCCNHRCVVDVPVTEKNIEFPKSFYQFGTHTGAVKIEDEKITARIKEMIVWLKYHPENTYKYEGCGDTFIIVFNHTDEYYITVCKNYFEASIDK